MNSDQLAADQIRRWRAEGEAAAALEDAGRMPPPSREWRSCWCCGGTGFTDCGTVGYAIQQQRCGICRGAKRLEYEVRR